MLRSSLIFCAFILDILVLPVGAYSQQWSAPRPLTGLPEVSLSVRTIVAQEGFRGNAVEWRFRNTSDSTLKFTYRLISDAADTIIGRVTIRRQRSVYSGWVIRGKRFENMFAEDVIITPAK